MDSNPEIRNPEIIEAEPQPDSDFEDAMSTASSLSDTSEVAAADDSASAPLDTVSNAICTYCGPTTTTFVDPDDPGFVKIQDPEDPDALPPLVDTPPLKATGAASGEVTESTGTPWAWLQLDSKLNWQFLKVQTKILFPAEWEREKEEHTEKESEDVVRFNSVINPTQDERTSLFIKEWLENKEKRNILFKVTDQLEKTDLDVGTATKLLMSLNDIQYSMDNYVVSKRPKSSPFLQGVLVSLRIVRLKVISVLSPENSESDPIFNPHIHWSTLKKQLDLLFPADYHTRILTKEEQEIQTRSEMLFGLIFNPNNDELANLFIDTWLINPEQRKKFFQIGEHDGSNNEIDLATAQQLSDDINEITIFFGDTSLLYKTKPSFLHGVLKAIQSISDKLLPVFEKATNSNSNMPPPKSIVTPDDEDENNEEAHFNWSFLRRHLNKLFPDDYYKRALSEEEDIKQKEGEFMFESMFNPGHNELTTLFIDKWLVDPEQRRKIFYITKYDGKTDKIDEATAKEILKLSDEVCTFFENNIHLNNNTRHSFLKNVSEAIRSVRVKIINILESGLLGQKNLRITYDYGYMDQIENLKRSPSLLEIIKAEVDNGIKLGVSTALKMGNSFQPLSVSKPNEVAEKLQQVYDNLKTQTKMTSPGMIDTLGIPMNMIDEAIKMCGATNNTPQEVSFPQMELNFNYGMFNDYPSFLETETYKALNIWETTLIYCVFCEMTHPGPHCYEGSCDHVTSIGRPYCKPGLTKCICENCERRHNVSISYSQINMPLINCDFCLRTHEGPPCRKGTCEELENPEICPIDHMTIQCNNMDCIHFKIDVNAYLQKQPTLFRCNECGARHHTTRQKKVFSVKCKGCVVRHPPPYCNFGTCTSFITKVTPLLSKEGYPLATPEPRYECKCGRRHLLNSHYNLYTNRNERKGVRQIHCIRCKETHPAPVCREGGCGEKPSGNGKITRKFLCAGCNDRHSDCPQKLKILFENTILEKCKSCDMTHETGMCVNAPTCEVAKYKIKNNITEKCEHRLKCGKCGIRHVERHALTTLFYYRFDKSRNVYVPYQRNVNNYCPPTLSRSTPKPVSTVDSSTGPSIEINAKTPVTKKLSNQQKKKDAKPERVRPVVEPNNPAIAQAKQFATAVKAVTTEEAERIAKAEKNLEEARLQLVRLKPPHPDQPTPSVIDTDKI